MLRILLLILTFLISTSYAQGVVTTTNQQGVTVSSGGLANPQAVPVSSDVNPQIVTISSGDQGTNGTSSTSVRPDNYCPNLSNYNIPAGYRIAGMSPSCQVVIIPMGN